MATSEDAPSTNTSYPEAARDVEADDGTYGSVAELARESVAIVVATVTGVDSLGRPSLEEDVSADEIVAITLDVDDVMFGPSVKQVVLLWPAIGYDENGNRAVRRVLNFVPPPWLGDRLVLFLRPRDPAVFASLGGVQTHELVALDGVGFLSAGHVTVSDPSGPLLGLTVDAIAGQIAEETG